MKGLIDKKKEKESSVKEILATYSVLEHPLLKEIEREIAIHESDGLLFLLLEKAITQDITIKQAFEQYEYAHYTDFKSDLSACKFACEVEYRTKLRDVPIELTPQCWNQTALAIITRLKEVLYKTKSFHT